MVSWNSGFSNGNIPSSAMVDYDGQGHYLQADAARSLRAFSNAFEAAFGTSITISEGYRSYATQVYYWNLYNSGRGFPAARPGTSTHGEAVAADFNSWIYGGGGTAKHNWLVNNAPRFGWSWTLVGKPSGESWHFNYVGGTSTSAGGGYTEISNEDDMPDAATTERIVRDQVDALLRDKWAQNIVDRVTGNLNTSLETIQRRIQKSVADAQADVKSASRREERERVVGIKGRDTRWSVNLDTGKVRRWSTPADLQFAVEHQLVASIQNPDGSWSAEAPNLFNNEAELKKFFELIAAPSNPTV